MNTIDLDDKYWEIMMDSFWGYSDRIVDWNTYLSRDYCNMYCGCDL